MSPTLSVFSALGFGLIAYLFGSLTPSIWVTRLIRGVDVRDSGSGHATTTNTIRQAGFGPGIVVFILDIAKGFIPTYLALSFAPVWSVPFVAGLVIMGHCWPVFAGFRGGMGLATAAGGLLAVNPIGALLGLGILVTLLLVIHHGARASVFTAILLAPFLWLVGLKDLIFWVALVEGVVIGLRFLIDWNRKYRELWLDREKTAT